MLLALTLTRSRLIEEPQPLLETQRRARDLVRKNHTDGVARRHEVDLITRIVTCSLLVTLAMSLL